MVATRHEHAVTIAERERLVERAVVGVDALQAEALRGRDAVVVGLLEQRLARRIVAVVLVGRI